MKKLYVIIISVFSLSNIFAQTTPDTIWSRTLGGSLYEAYGIFLKGKAAIDITQDEKYLYVGTTSSSIDGDVADTLGNLDGWVIKLDAQTGKTVWKDVMGGSYYDHITDITATSDGGCIVCGFSNSLDGDFENKGLHLNLNIPEYIFTDGFIAKYSAEGVLEWTKMYGGQPLARDTYIGEDELYKIINTKDGNYLAIGYTFSTSDDIPVDLEKFMGGWILKVDKDGKILYTDKFVGTNHDEYNDNKFIDVIETQENVFYLAGEQAYVKAQGNVMLLENYVWVVKSDGKQILEQAEYGTSQSETWVTGITQAEDNSLLVAATVRSGGGDISQAYGDFDVWVMKMNESLGLQDERTYGGTGPDFPYGIVSDNNGHFLMPCFTRSSDYDAIGGFGMLDFWTLNIEQDLDTVQTLRLGGTQNDRLTDAVFTKNGSKVYITGRTDSNDNYVSNNKGNGDIWVSAVNQEVSLSIDDKIQDNFETEIFPNPSNGVFSILKLKNSTYKISDIAGKKIQSGKIFSDNHSIDLRNSNRGIYFVEIKKQGCDKRIVTKFVIN